MRWKREYEGLFKSATRKVGSPLFLARAVLQATSLPAPPSRVLLRLSLSSLNLLIPRQYNRDWPLSASPENIFAFTQPSRHQESEQGNLHGVGLPADIIPYVA
jgi:hypothetical protein